MSHSSSQLDKSYPSNVKGKALKHLESQSETEKDPFARDLWVQLFANRVGYKWIHRKSTKFLNGCTILD